MQQAQHVEDEFQTGCQATPETREHNADPELPGEAVTRQRNLRPRDDNQKNDNGHRESSIVYKRPATHIGANENENDARNIKKLFGLAVCLYCVVYWSAWLIRETPDSVLFYVGCFILTCTLVGLAVSFHGISTTASLTIRIFYGLLAIGFTAYLWFLFLLSLVAHAIGNVLK